MRALLLALAALALAVPAASAAPRPCWQRVIQDWYDDGRIDGDWSCACLQEAVRHLPVDTAANDARRLIDAAEKKACAARTSPVERVTTSPAKATKHRRNVPALVVSTILAVVVCVLLIWRRRQATTSRDGRRARDRE